MELCEDLMHRMMDYNILHIFDLQVVIKKMHHKWQVTLLKKPEFLERLADKSELKIISFLSSLMEQLYKATSLIGLATYVSTKA